MGRAARGKGIAIRGSVQPAWCVPTTWGRTMGCRLITTCVKPEVGEGMVTRTIVGTMGRAVRGKGIVTRGQCAAGLVCCQRRGGELWDAG